jgi:hypothetical protein
VSFETLICDISFFDLQQYGDIQTLHTSCKNHGSVTVSYYDIRAAQNAMRSLRNKPLGHMNLNVKFSIPEVNTLLDFFEVEMFHNLNVIQSVKPVSQYVTVVWLNI